MRDRLDQRIAIAWLYLFAILGLLAVVPFIKVVDPDYWWHLRTGERILDSGIPRHDAYSWTAAGEPWVAHEWLSEALIAALDDLGGYGANVAFFDLAGVGAVVLAFALGRALGASGRALVLCSFVSALTVVLYLVPRPQVLTWLLFAYVLLILGGPRPPRGAVWSLPALFVLWANLHLGFLFGLMLLVAWVFVGWLERGSARTYPQPSRFALLTACGAATCITPHGPELLVYPLRYLEDRGSLSFVGEWVSPFARPSPFLLPYYVSFAALALCLVFRRPPAFLAVVTVALLAASATSSRNVPFVALVFIPVAACAISPGSAPESTLPVRRAAPFTAVLGAIVAFASFSAAGGAGGWRDMRTDTYPAEGVDYIRTRYPQARMFNSYGWGGYIIHAAPELRVFIDGRSDLYRSTMLRDYADIRRTEGDWQGKIDSYGIDVMLIPADSRLAGALRADSRWRLEYEGDVEAVFARVTTARDAETGWPAGGQ